MLQRPQRQSQRPGTDGGVRARDRHHVTEVVNTDDPTERYANGAPIPAGTKLTVVVPIGPPCG